MPLTIPSLDDRKYRDLVQEALARIPVHNPEWTNFNESDPGVTIVELFAFLTESLLYRCNQIPERNRNKFLQLLGIPLNPGSAARGLVTFSGGADVVSLKSGLELRAGQVPFVTTTGVDVLPVEARTYYKKPVANPSAQIRKHYERLYLTFSESPGIPAFSLYETVALETTGALGIDLAADTIDNSLWIALLVPQNAPNKPKPSDWAAKLRSQTLTIGIDTAVDQPAAHLLPVRTDGQASPNLQVWIPAAGPGQTLSSNPADRTAKYTQVQATSSLGDIGEPGTIQVSLPSNQDEITTWADSDFQPLEAGTNGFPPVLESDDLTNRLVTWILVQPSNTLPFRIVSAAINAANVEQRVRVTSEALTQGTGEADQVVKLRKTPVMDGSVRLVVSSLGSVKVWREIDDLLNAPPETESDDTANVFALNPESGEVRFGDGVHGARPAAGAELRADYDYSLGSAGNLGPGAINTGPALPTGIKVTNPVPTWGGADPEQVVDAEKQIPRYLQHRDRLVNAADFETIALRTPGVDVARVDVLPAFSPELAPNEPGDAPGAVTLMVIPSFDSVRPNAPSPNQIFLDTICDYLDSRRLVTTELFLRGPQYKDIWISGGIKVLPGKSVVDVTEAVKSALIQFLSPLPPADPASVQTGMEKGWPLKKPVLALELIAQVNRVPGVALVYGLTLMEAGKGETTQVCMKGLELPRVAGILLNAGQPASLSQTIGQGAAAPTVRYLPIPVVPEEC